MRHISDHETVHDWWEALDAEFNGADFERVRKRWYQQKLTVAIHGGSFVTCLTVSTWNKPLALRVSERSLETDPHDVTKIDFMDGYLGDDGRQKKVGHLVLPKVPHEPSHGLHIVQMAEIPDEAMHSLDKGVSLLRTRASV